MWALAASVTEDLPRFEMVKAIQATITLVSRNNMLRRIH
ncbi:hypothetical protein VCHE09_3163 [Vibrio paracholerae HE-09]|nr:hypothetical protein VCHE09_3163 [Vibrio paracholerae HE-09]